MDKRINRFIFLYLIENSLINNNIDIYKLIKEYEKFLYMYDRLTIGHTIRGQNE